jgi:antitoxin VapB
MIETRTAKLFRNGASQAVRLPAEYRFEAEEVFIRRDPLTGDVLLSTHPNTGVWAELFALLDSIDVPPDYLTERPMNIVTSAAGLFDDAADVAA